MPSCPGHLQAVPRAAGAPSSPLHVVVVQLVGTGPDQHPERSKAWSRILLGRPASGCLKNLRSQQFPSRHEKTNTPSLQRGHSGPGQPWPPAHAPAYRRLCPQPSSWFRWEVLTPCSHEAGPGPFVFRCLSGLWARPGGSGVPAGVPSAATPCLLGWEEPPSTPSGSGDFE